MGNSFDTSTASGSSAAIATATAGPSYSTVSEMYLRFGVDTVNQFADEVGQASQSDMNNRIQQALNVGYAKVNQDFYRTNYRVPFTADSDGMYLIKIWEQDEAIAWMYEMRGARDKDAKGNQFSQLIERSRAERAEYIAGRKRLNASRKWPTATSPVAC